MEKNKEKSNEGKKAWKDFGWKDFSWLLRLTMLKLCDIEYLKTYRNKIHQKIVWNPSMETVWWRRKTLAAPLKMASQLEDPSSNPNRHLNSSPGFLPRYP